MFTELFVAVAISTATTVAPITFQDSIAIESILTPPPLSWGAQFNDVMKLINTRHNTSDEALRWALYIMKYSKEANINPKRFAALIRVESHGNPNAISVMGAVGLTQVMPRFWNNVYPECGPTSETIVFGQGFAHPQTSICYGTKILEFYIQKASTWFVLELTPQLKIPFAFVPDMQYALNLYSGFAKQYANNSSPYSARITSFLEGET